MYRIVNCSKDTYITDRIVNNSFRAVDANVGHAATLDLFQLFNESTLSGTTNPFERSRLLVKFDTDKLRDIITQSNIDITSPSFHVVLSLSDVTSPHPTPSNYSIDVYPLSKSFDEGIGLDVGMFSDIDVSNWLTASISMGLSTWTDQGAARTGVLGDTDIDVITSGDLSDGNGVVSLGRTQVFTDGTEDLNVDVTTLMSATLAGLIPDHGFRVSLSDATEAISSSFFVKRFASRHVSIDRLRPKLIVRYDDSFRDDVNNFTFDTTGSLFLHNYVMGQLANVVSGSAAIPLTGSNVMTLKLISGAISPSVSSSFTASYSVDQFSRGDNFLTGVYVSRFAVSSFDPALIDEVQSAGSASFTVIWGTNDGTYAYKTGSLVIRTPMTDTGVIDEKQYTVHMTNMRSTYSIDTMQRMRLTILDESVETDLFFSKLPVRRTGVIVDRMYWRLKDVYTDDIVIPFGIDDNSTLLSVDSKGMFFDFYVEDLTVGRVYKFEFLIKDYGKDVIIDDLPSFRVVK